MKCYTKIVAIVMLSLLVPISVLQANPEQECRDAGCRWERGPGGWSCNCD